MCYLLTVSFSHELPLKDLYTILSSFGQSFKLYSDSPIQKLLPPGTHYGTLSEGCDCGTSIGGKFYAPVDNELSEDKIQELRKRGWKKEKINRWVQEKEIKIKQQYVKDRQIFDEDLQEWHELIVHVLSTSRLRTFGLLKHDYKGDFEKEIFSFSRLSLPVSKLSTDYLLNLPEDVMCEFSK
jgi:hypothetical protein